MDVGAFSDQQLVDCIEAEAAVPRAVIDEYYRRCIPLYLDFIGIHWHTGFYREQDEGVSPADQERMVDHVVDSINLSKTDRLLDVGCGIGATICYLNGKYDCEAVGLTPVEEQRLAAINLSRMKNVSIHVDIGHAEKLPYPDASFDVVTCFESPCHFKDRQAFFDEVYRVLKPGGRLAGEDWMATDLFQAETTRAWIEPICKAWAIPMLGDASEYRNLMYNAGLVDVVVADLRELMPLHKGFAVGEKDQYDLQREQERCSNPLFALTLKGLARLGLALGAGAFTIGQFKALKPLQPTTGEST
jgi:tocopherol O-methyltransferase